ncbi:hypothetical protein GUJ93_ZPchr0015g6878 [Zizania palustris]|uniref:UBA domain-containing protein n=1 Tax=Zizania palustris TaxID=103762 RepID=A0A8J5TB57_ZIZPA|nr:hypothetical protein GUJ93_ZPchr0015g6878 [Zizania palustris]
MGSGDGMKELIEKRAAKIDDLKTSLDKLAPLARVAEQLATLPSKVVALQSSAFENQEQGFLQEMSQKDEKIKSIVSMGFPKDEAKMAITRCGLDASVEVLVDSIYASETAGNAYSANLSDYEDTKSISFGRKKTKFMKGSQKKRKRYGSGSQGNPVPFDGSHEEPMPLPNPMVGFSLPSDRGVSYSWKEIFFPCLKLRWVPKVIATSNAAVCTSTAIVPFVHDPKTSSSEPSLLTPQASMANYPMDPLAYVPRGGVLLDGGGELRKIRNVVALSGQHIRKNEDLAIANCEEFLTAVERHEFLLLIHHHLTQVLRLQVLRYGVYPSGVGFFKMGSLFQRDSIVNNGPHWIGERLVSFVKHDEDGFPADEDELPPNGGNPHPFNGEVFPGDPNWVQQWVDDQLPRAGFPNGNIVEQVFPEQQGNINPMEDLPQWEQWPNHNNNAPQVPQQQEELSVEVSGLSVGFNSGSTAASGHLVATTVDRQQHNIIQCLLSLELYHLL